MKKGVTLIELTVATAVIGMLIVLIMTFLTDKIIDNAIKNARADLQLETQLTLDVINRDIKHSANVDNLNRWPDPYAPNAPADEYSWQSNGTTLILTQPAQDGGRNVLFEDPLGYISYKDNHIYFVQDGTLFKRTLAAPVSGNRSQNSCPALTPDCISDIVLATDVENFTINYYDADDNEVPPEGARSVGVTLRIVKEVFNRDIEAEYSIIRTVFRNE